MLEPPVHTLHQCPSRLLHIHVQLYVYMYQPCVVHIHVHVCYLLRQHSM